MRPKQGEYCQTQKKHLQYPTIVAGFFPKINNSWKHQSENLQDPIFPYISWPAIHLLQLKAFWQICSWGTSKKHRLNVAIANRSESHSLCPAGGKLKNNCTLPTCTKKRRPGGVSLRSSWSWTPGVNWLIETENWCFVIQCVVILCLNPYSVLTSCIPLRPLDCLRTNLVERDAWRQSVQSICMMFCLYTISLNHYGTRLHSSSALTVVNCLGDWF